MAVETITQEKNIMHVKVTLLAPNWDEKKGEWVEEKLISTN